VCRYGVFKVRTAFCAVSQNSAAKRNVEVDIVLGDPVIRTASKRHRRAGSHRSNRSGIP
jgi:hypothetical protein